MYISPPVALLFHLLNHFCWFLGIVKQIKTTGWANDAHFIFCFHHFASYLWFITLHLLIYLAFPVHKMHTEHLTYVIWFNVQVLPKEPSKPSPQSQGWLVAEVEIKLQLTWGAGACRSPEPGRSQVIARGTPVHPQISILRSSAGNNVDCWVEANIPHQNKYILKINDIY